MYRHGRTAPMYTGRLNDPRSLLYQDAIMIAHLSAEGYCKQRGCLFPSWKSESRIYPHWEKKNWEFRHELRAWDERICRRKRIDPRKFCKGKRVNEAPNNFGSKPASRRCKEFRCWPEPWDREHNLCHLFHPRVLLGFVLQRSMYRGGVPKDMRSNNWGLRDLFARGLWKDNRCINCN